MDTKRKYFTIMDLVDASVKAAHEEPAFDSAKGVCPLDYEIISHCVKYDKLYRCDFDVIGHVCYGDSEGIYGEIYLFGSWNKELAEAPNNARFRIYTLKTLETSKECYLAMGTMVNLICYHANRFVSEHLDQFD